jgi:DNA-binding response OmpR family regulator
LPASCIGRNDTDMPSRKALVLAVDDDIRILRMMRRILELGGYRVVTASNGEAALEAFAEETPGLVLLDIMLPDIDGYTVCQRIREFSLVPIIMVTAKGNEEEKVIGLDAGADDYITKPFSSQELAARVRAVLRRTRLQDGSTEPALSYLARNAGRVATPDQILEKVWGEDYLGESHLLQVNMARLRRKLGDEIKNPRYIATEPGIGYMMVKKA